MVWPWEVKCCINNQTEVVFCNHSVLRSRRKLMQSFLTFLREATSVDDEMLGHLTHTKDLPHEDPKHAQTAIDLIDQFHKKRMGQKSSVGASLKTDGGASVHVIHDKDGVGVSDKHRIARGVIARTPKEVDQHFGHQPEYAASLKRLLKHGHEFVNKGHHVQGDLLHTPDSPGEKSGDVTKTTPNRITYKAKTKAPIGLAVHTEITKGVAHGVTKNALKHSNNVFVPEHEYKANPETYSEKDRQSTEKHLDAAKELLKKHTSEHLTPEHINVKKGGHFTTYLNRTTRRGENASIEGYKKHLDGEAKKAVNKLKTPVGQVRKQAEFDKLKSHVDDNAKHFQRSLDIRHHLGQATEHLLKGVSHPDMETSIDGKKSQGEGIVLQKKDKEGKMRPMTKLVPVKVSNSILNNPRFAK